MNFSNPVATFAGLPGCSNLSDLAAHLAILGIPHGTPYHPNRTGHSVTAPAAIRAASAKFAPFLEHYDFDLDGPLIPPDRAMRVVDCGDLPGDPAQPVENRQRATQAVRALLDAGIVPLLLGGDDSVPIPILHAYQNYAPLTIVQIDAHIDWRDEVDGEREGYSSTMRRASELAWVGDIVQVGMRGVGSARKDDVEAAHNYGASLITAQTIHTHGIAPVLDKVPAGAPCFISLDCDGLDPSALPAVAAPSPGGLSYIQVISLLHALAQKSRIAGFALVELAPDKDVQGLGALVAVRILWNMIGALVRAPWLTASD
jgi:agmatinase